MNLVLNEVENKYLRWQVTEFVFGRGGSRANERSRWAALGAGQSEKGKLRGQSAGAGFARRKPEFGHRVGRRARRLSPFPRRPRRRAPLPLNIPPCPACAMLRLVSSASKPSSAGVLAKVVAAPSSTRSSMFSPIEHGLLIKQRRLCLGRRSFASSSARQADITLTVDGKEVTVPQGAYSYGRSWGRLERHNTGIQVRH